MSEPAYKVWRKQRLENGIRLVQMSLPVEVIELIDNYQFKNKLNSRGEVIVKIISQLGI